MKAGFPTLGHAFVWALVVSMALVGATAQARPRRAHAAPDPEAARTRRACMAAYFEAQEQLAAGRLREARERYLACSDDGCGGVLQSECRAKYAQLGSDIPTVVPVVTGRGGAPLVDVDVSVDGVPLTQRLDGRGLPVDPGLHLFSFATDSETVELKVMVVQGERNRAITVTLGKGRDRDDAAPALAAPAADDAPLAKAGKPSLAARPRRRDEDAPQPPSDDEPEVVRPRSRPKKPESSSLPTYLLAGVGVAGLGTYGALVTWARDDNRRLQACSPNCPPASVEHIRKMYLGADVALGLGATALAASTLVYVLSLPTKKSARYSFDFRPSATGAMASVGGVF